MSGYVLCACGLPDAMAHVCDRWNEPKSYSTHIEDEPCVKCGGCGRAYTGFIGEICLRCGGSGFQDETYSAMGSDRRENRRDLNVDNDIARRMPPQVALAWVTLIKACATQEAEAVRQMHLELEAFK